MSLLAPRQWPRSAWLLIAVNALPLWGVFALGWEPGELLWLYWAENLVIGAFAALRIGAARGGDMPPPGRYALIPFFLVHYGLFCLGHGLLLTVIADRSSGDPFSAMFSFAWLAQLDGALWVILALLLSHGYSFAADYLGAGEFRRAQPQAEMLRPYARILIMHATVLAGGALAIFLGAPALAIAVLVGVKTAADLAAHLRERGRAAAAATTSAPAPD